jgi:hypothetical protein
MRVIAQKNRGRPHVGWPVEYKTLALPGVGARACPGEYTGRVYLGFHAITRPAPACRIADARLIEGRNVKINIPFRNPRTGEQRTVKLGWSWTLFWFSGFLGLPLFHRRLWNWGFALLAYWVALQFSIYVIQNDALTMMLIFVSICLATFLGLKGNEMTAKQYLDDGWQFADPDGEGTRYAKFKWQLTPISELGYATERRDPQF